MASGFETLSINGFEIKYNLDSLLIEVNYNGGPLENKVKQPTITVKPKDPLNSFVAYDRDLMEMADKVFDTMATLYSQNEHCVTALFASHFYMLIGGGLQDDYMKNGNHILCVPLWLSIIGLVKNWEKKHQGISLHIGTPLYFLAQAFLLTQNNDKAFAYLIKSIEDDTKLGEHCPMLNYPANEPAYRTACLIDHEGNYMYDFIVKPLRSEIANAIKKYNNLFGKESHLANIDGLDQKFLQRRNTTKRKVEHIKYLFVLELMKLLQLRTVEIDSEFFQTLLLNRLFGLSLVVDKLLYVLYPPKPTPKKRWEDPKMWKCVVSYGNWLLHKNSEPDLCNLKLYDLSPEKALKFLMLERTQGKFMVFPREIYSILISYIIRNTSAHKIQAINLLSSQSEEILQCLLESVFILTGHMRKPKQNTN